MAELLRYFNIVPTGNSTFICNGNTSVQVVGRFRFKITSSGGDPPCEVQFSQIDDMLGIPKRMLVNGRDTSEVMTDMRRQILSLYRFLGCSTAGLQHGGNEGGEEHEQTEGNGQPPVLSPGALDARYIDMMEEHETRLGPERTQRVTQWTEQLRDAFASPDEWAELLSKIHGENRDSEMIFAVNTYVAWQLDRLTNDASTEIESRRATGTAQVAEITHLHRMLQDSLHTRANLETDMSNAQAHIVDLQGRLRESQQAHNRAQADMSTAQAHIVDLQRRLRGSQQAHNSAQADIVVHQALFHDLRQRHSALQAQITELQASESDLRSKLSVAETALASKVSKAPQQKGRRWFMTAVMAILFLFLIVTLNLGYGSDIVSKMRVPPLASPVDAWFSHYSPYTFVRQDEIAAYKKYIAELQGNEGRLQYTTMQQKSKELVTAEKIAHLEEEVEDHEKREAKEKQDALWNWSYFAAGGSTVIGRKRSLAKGSSRRKGAIRSRSRIKLSKNRSRSKSRSTSRSRSKSSRAKSRRKSIKKSNR